MLAETKPDIASDLPLPRISIEMAAFSIENSTKNAAIRFTPFRSTLTRFCSILTRSTHFDLLFIYMYQVGLPLTLLSS